jgi:site-specific DNA-cytosine methylase
MGCMRETKFTFEPLDDSRFDRHTNDELSINNFTPNGSPSGTPLIDLFCGAGGLTLGFTKRFGHNFVPVWANDFNDYAVATYNTNFGNHCIPGDIVDILEDPETVIPSAEVVIGGPPCQGFSLLNKGKTHDPRKQLWRPCLNVVERSGAQIFVNNEGAIL